MIQLHSYFQDHAVFQQGMWLPVFGKAAAGSRLKMEFAGKCVFTRVNAAGSFKFRFPPLEAGGPYSLKITDLENGDTAEIHDILIGEVWLASGQSNMEYNLSGKGYARPTGSNESPLAEEQASEFISTLVQNGTFRCLKIGKNASGVQEETFCGTWENVTPENALVSSAVALWFGKKIQETLNVPVGLIFSSWGGSMVQSWTSRNGFLTTPGTAHLARKLDSEIGKEDLWDERAASQKPSPVPQEFADPGNKGVGNGWADPDFDDSGWEIFTIPGSWMGQQRAGNGAVWIRNTLELPPHWAGKKLTLNLGPIDKMDISYFNGSEIGRTGKELETAFWNTRRIYSIPGSLVKNGKNTVAIRAYSFIDDGAFNGLPEFYSLTEPESGESILIAGSWKFRSELDLGVTKRLPQRIGPCNIHTPGILFDGMINPVKTCAIRGVIWYQGENNANTMADALSYREELGNMIRDWRYQWEQGDFPFIQVQLANYFRGKKMEYDPESCWAVLRDHQRGVCEDLPGVYMVSAVDVGEALDIHPQNKKSVGLRLAYCALNHVYDYKEIIPAGPLYDGFTVEGCSVRVTFRYTEGMTLKSELPQSFYLAGSDRIFYPADTARIEDNAVILSSARVETPCAVRYAWSGNPTSTLYNAAGFPASPFRTDHWEI